MVISIIEVPKKVLYVHNEHWKNARWITHLVEVAFELNFDFWVDSA